MDNTKKQPINYEVKYNGLVDARLFVIDNKEKDVVVRKRDSGVESYILKEVCDIIAKTKK